MTYSQSPQPDPTPKPTEGQKSSQIDTDHNDRWFNRALLLDAAQCPACGTPLSTADCTQCGVELGGGRGVALWNLSKQIAANLNARDTRLARLRLPDMSEPTNDPNNSEQFSPHWFDRSLLWDTTRCPGCATPLQTQLCDQCGLNLAAPEAGRVWTISQQIANQLEERDQIITDATPVSRLNLSTVGPDRPHAMASAVAISPTRGANNNDSVEKGKLWSVQNVLLVLGAALLAGASIIFLAFSWGKLDLGLRALVIGGFTAVLFFAAWFTKRKGLRASAEAISGLAALTLYLDAWALRVTELITLGTLANYVAAISVVTGTALIGIGLFMRLVTPRFFGTALIPLGAVALAIGQPTALTATLVLAVGACLGLAMFLPRSDRKTLIALCISTGLLLLSAAFTALLAWTASGDGPGAASLSFISITMGLYAWLSPHFRRALAIVTALLATTAGLGFGTWMLSKVPEPVFSPRWDGTALPILGAILIPFVLHGVSRITSRSTHRGLDPIAVRTAIIVNAIFIVPSIATAGLMLAVEPFAGSATDVPYTVQALVGITIFSLGAVVLRLCNIGGRWSHHFAVWSLVTVITVLPAAAPGVLLPFGLWMTVAISAALITAVAKPRGVSRLPLRALSWLPIPPALVLSVGNSDGTNSTEVTSLELIGILGIVIGGILFSIRSWEAWRQVPLESVSRAPAQTQTMPIPGWTPPPGKAPRVQPQRRYEPMGPIERAMLLGGSISLASFGLMGLLASRLADSLGAPLIVGLILLTISTAVLVLVAGGRRRSTADVRALLASSVFLVVLLAPALWGNLSVLTTDWLRVLAVSCSVLVLLHPVILTFSARIRIAAEDKTRTYVATLVPLGALLLVRTLTTLDPTDQIEWSLVALGSLVVPPALAGWTLTRAPARRQALEYATLIGVIFLLLVLLTDSRTLGLTVLIMAASAFLLATTPARGMFIWFGYAFTIISSWILSATYGLDFIEVYTVPFALLLCALGEAMLRKGRSHLLLIAGLAVLTIPTVIRSWQADSWRDWAIVVTTTLVALLLASSKVRRGDMRATQWPLIRDLGLLNLAIVLLGPLTVSVRFSQDAATLPAFIWLLLAAELTTITCVALDVPGHQSHIKSPRVWGPFLVVAVLTIPTAVLVYNQALSASASTIAAVTLIVAWGTLALVGAPPGKPRVRNLEVSTVRAVLPLAVALGLAVILAPKTPLPADALLTVAGSFIALVTIRVAQVLQKVSTWANVGFGVVATVAPFSVTMLGHATGWRVTLAVLIASAWLLFGVKAQWQAPVVLGALALLAQVAVLAGPPALAAFAGLQSWMVLAIVGAVLLVSGLMYERQVIHAKSAIKKLSDLR